MDRLAHAHIPAGTLADLNSGSPVTVTRDYTHAHIPAMELDLAGVRALMRMLSGLCDDMAAAWAEEEAEAAELAAELGLCDSTLPLRGGGELKCEVDTDGAGYHYGAHSACGGKRRWLGTGADARTEEGDLVVVDPIDGQGSDLD